MPSCLCISIQRIYKRCSSFYFQIILLNLWNNHVRLIYTRDVISSGYRLCQFFSHRAKNSIDGDGRAATHASGLVLARCSSCWCCHRWPREHVQHAAFDSYPSAKIRHVRGRSNAPAVNRFKNIFFYHSRLRPWRADMGIAAATIWCVRAQGPCGADTRYLCTRYIYKYMS